jgi:hypothetical protein
MFSHLVLNDCAVFVILTSSRKYQTNVLNHVIQLMVFGAPESQIMRSMECLIYFDVDAHDQVDFFWTLIFLIYRLSQIMVSIRTSEKQNQFSTEVIRAVRIFFATQLIVRQTFLCLKGSVL